MSGLYIHIPFCKQACSYCDFYFVTRHQNKQDFVDQLIAEIHSKNDSRFTTEPVHSIYFGGGTPSLLSSAQVGSILEAVEQVFDTHLKEVTFELNPDDVNPRYLQELRACGVTRASMGVQSFDQQLLNFMNRAHTSEEAMRCLEILRDSHLDVFSADLIYGNPGQSLEVLERDIDTLLQFNPPHVSAYSLTVEPRTRLGKQVELGRIVPPEDDVVADHFDMVIQKLAAAGIQQYEVSNFARPGHEAVHNSNYWSHENYLGLGPAAHSFWWDENRKTAQRWSNEPDLRSYLAGGWQNPHEPERLELPQLAEERLMLGLRTRAGVSEDELFNRYDFRFTEKQRSYLEKLQYEANAELDDFIRLTPEGLRIADTLLLDLLTA